MAAKRRSKRKAGRSCRSTGAGDKDRRIAELENRVAILENELRSYLENTGSIDFVELKRARERLRADEERYRSLIESTGDWIWETDQDFVLTYDSPKGQEILGYKPEEVIGRAPFSLMPPDELERIKLIAWPAIARHEPIKQIENRVIKKDGSIAIIETTGIPLFDESGRYRGYRGVNRDITERKRAEEALKSSEAKFRTLFEGGGVATFVADVATGKIIDCNGKAETLIGRPREEIIGLHQTELHPAEQADTYREMFARHASTDGSRNFEAAVQHRDGRVIPVVINAAPLTVDGREILIGFFLDITERKRAEDALQLMQHVIDRVQDWASLITPDGRFSYVNDAHCRALGYTREELLARHIWDVDIDVTEDRWPRIWSELKEKGFLKVEDRHRASDGRTFPTEICVSYLNFHDTEYMCGFVRDITERKRAEEEMVAAKQQAELYLDLMGHDINNMHQIALGYLEIAEGMTPENDSRNEFIKKTIEVLQRSAQLIKNVRKLQKLNEGVFQYRDIDVCEVLAGIRREFGAVPNKTITLNMNGCERCPVHANDLLHDVFANLVGNAIKHTGDRADIDIVLNVVKDNSGRYCRVSVEDNGPGIPDDFKSVIFNRMLKGTDKAKGMGLGLYLVKSLVDSYGGRVWVEDRVKGDHTKGARFVVMLPAAEK